MTSTDYERTILRNIDERGWFCTSVFDPEGKVVSFSYSVGFTKTLACPEFIVFGLDIKLMHSMLWSVFRQIEAGRAPEDNQRWSGLIEGYDCIARAVHPTNIAREYLNSAMWFWGDAGERGPLKAFQLVWPSAGTGLYPWDEGCSQLVRDSQPPLYLPNRAVLNS